MALETKPKFRIIEDTFRQQITSGKLKPGQKIPSDRDLSRTYAVTPTTISKALASLAKEGFIDRAPGRGTYIKSTEWHEKTGLYSLLVSQEIPSLHDIPVFNEILLGASEQLSPQKEHIVFCQYSPFRIAGGELPEPLVDNKVDGAILLNEPEPRICEVLNRSNIPVVSVLSDGGGILPCVVSDDLKGGRLLVDHLVALGHRRIAYVGTQREYSWDRLRFQGYREGLRAAGLNVDYNLVVRTKSSLEGGFRAAQELTERGVNYSAVIIAVSLVAQGLIQELMGQGVRIPQALSVATFNNLPEGAQASPIETTAIHIDFRKIGRIAAEILAAACEKGSFDRLTNVVPVNLVQRKSTAPFDSSRSSAE